MARRRGAVTRTALRRSIFVLLLGILTACNQAQEEQQQALQFVQGWFAQAASGQRAEHLCHGLGLLKHPQFSCAELLEHAALINAEQRTLTHMQRRDCLGDVCGDFVELTFSGYDQAGNESEEIALLKKDDGVLRLYWYRSTSLLALLASANDDNKKSAEQAAYTELTQRYPSLYQWPPCYSVRVSPTNLLGKLTPRDQVDTELVASQAAACGEPFCFAFVGRKVASVCPQ